MLKHKFKSALENASSILTKNAHLPFITFVNFAIVGFGIVKTLLAVRWLGASNYGAVALLTSLALVSINFIDVRLSDIAAKAFFIAVPDHERHNHQRNIVQSTLIGTFIMGLLACLAGIAITYIAKPYVLKTHEPDFAMILLSNAGQALTFVALVPPLFLRLIEHTKMMGWVRLISQMLSGIVFLFILYFDQTIKGYLVAVFWSQIVVLVYLIAALFYFFQRHHQMILWIKPHGKDVAEFFRRESRNIFGGNLFGYTKMLHRGLDTLLVGLLADEVAAGIYRLARILLDAMNVFYDSLQQVLMPRFFQFLADHKKKEFHLLAKQLVLFAAAFTMTAFIGALVTLPFINQYFLHNQYPYLNYCVAILCLTFFFIAGIHIWLWPLLMQDKKIVEFSWFSLCAAALQWVATAALFYAGIHAAIAASLGLLTYYIALYPFSLIWAKGKTK